jgi:hypothetical protein
MEEINEMPRINETDNSFFEKTTNGDKLLSKLTKKGGKERVITQSNKTGGKKGMLQKIPMKSTGSLGNILKIHSPINWKMWKKWTKLYTQMTYQN